MRLSGVVFSKTLGMDTGITIVTPREVKEQYNTVYLLHGLRGDNRTWLDRSMLSVYASKRNSIYVLPSVQRSFYTNMKYGFDYFTYITEELPEICKSVFNISSKRKNTAIMGYSMGGYGALMCALSKPEQYGKCAAFSTGGLFLKQYLDEFRKNGVSENIKNTFGRLDIDFKSIFGENYEYRPELDLTELLKKNEQKPELFLTCGKDDFFYNDHISFCKVLNTLDIPHTFEELDGEHDFICFNEALKRAIEKFDL